ncbi:MAG: cobalamin biosynthesis protein CobD [Deltaproteobacteria bacterium RIFOXYD12_FULL_50_9]|nr:MAG: cobalamin biosynthesis protein CobD [Deltaproteobacteria bacterium RIFOXYD12_FULL_50_9]
MISLETQIILALGLDQLFGDPRWLPHPVRLIGNLAGKAEKGCRALINNQRIAGLLTVCLVLAATLLTTLGLLKGAALLHPVFGVLLSVVLLYTSLATRDLAGHSQAVYQALAMGNQELARQRVAMMVGRDTANLDKEGISRACVESVAENIVDGVTAPLFYAALLGPVGALLYKAVNTMDSTCGYKNERYLRFGWAAARLDDLVNFVPARLTGLLVVLAAPLLGLSGRQAWRIFWRDRLKHASPNSGHPEAAAAGALGVQLGGANSYFGQPVIKPTIGDPWHPVAQEDIRLVNRLLLITTLLAALLLIALRWAGTRLI